LGLLALGQCGQPAGVEHALLERLDARETRIDFENTITPDATFNLLDFEYLYNGGGVGVGDFNNDGLPDLVFTGNQVASQIYTNKGNLTFEVLPASSGFDTRGKWCTGVTVTDINADGWDDIYVCVGGPGKQSNHPNLLFVNQGNGTFVESAAAYGLADPSESNQAVFFDYDLDGDLDMYLLNGGGFEKSAIAIRPIAKDGSARNTDRLYQNNPDAALGHPVFTDVSAAAGITWEGFGLGVSVLDCNADGWPDLYVTNDYLSPDLLYINQQNGTFAEAGAAHFGHTSHFSMGNDVGDINNDGRSDIVSLDMLPEGHQRRQLMFGPNQYDRFQAAVRQGYGHQYMRNMVQLANADHTFSEIGQLAGVDRTDWSWAPLLADFDNDGFKDLYITNGYGKDITDLDYVKFKNDAIGPGATPEKVRATLLQSLDERPAIAVPNYLYRNRGDLTFENMTPTWLASPPSLSNGAVYVDLDGDGDLELVVNNIDQAAFVYQNKSREQQPTQSNYLQIQLQGTPQNPKGIGAEVRVFAGGVAQYSYHQTVRGFQSCATDVLHFGLGAANAVDSITVRWPDGQQQTLRQVTANQRVTLRHTDAQPSQPQTAPPATWLQKTNLLAFQRIDPETPQDYKAQPLLLHGFTRQGPCMAVADVNNDGRADLYIGGAYGQSGSIFLQTGRQTFQAKPIPSELYEDTGAAFLDIDQDSDQDLYVASGGSERYANHPAYQDRLYLNDGQGNFAIDTTRLPTLTSSTSTVAAADFDGDGDTDLFVGGRVVPGQYPLAPRSYLLENQQGRLIDATARLCPALASPGMVTAAIWTDVDADGRPDLMIAGELMPITWYRNTGKGFVKMDSGLEASTGFWNCIAQADLDGDGDMDYVLGNVGLNTPYRSSQKHPLQLHYADFDGNGSVDPIFSQYEEGAYYPLASLDLLTGQLPALKQALHYHRDYAAATLDDILRLLPGPKPNVLTCAQAASAVVENLGNGQFKLRPLPLVAQTAPVRGILLQDFDTDGRIDLLLVGNDYDREVISGQMDASRGVLLLNRGPWQFQQADAQTTGLSTAGDTRSIVDLPWADGSRLIIVGKNNAAPETYLWTTKSRNIQ
jgi:hypothetical protein